jgi:putative ABC transport system ATP-binding protein
MILFEHVTKRYRGPADEVTALADVTLHVAPGEFVSVRGPSGSGKSTLLSIAGALTTATTGRVVVAGEELASLSSAGRARLRAERIGFVFQMFYLLPYLNVRDNVLAAANGNHDAASDAVYLLDRFGLAHRLMHRPAELSAGERQRVAIARAMINRPQIILADEPTGNLDAVSAAAVLDHLADFHRAGGTLVLVTHDAAAAQRANRQLVLDAGRLAESIPTRTQT